MILLEVTPDDIVKLQDIISSKGFEIPTIKISVYKNRRGTHKGIYLWCKADLGTCRIEPMFCTGYNYIYKDIDQMAIQIDESAFEEES